MTRPLGNLYLALIVLCVVIGVNFAIVTFVVVPKISSGVEANCRSINRVVSAGVRILDSPGNMKRAYEAGKLSRREYAAGLEQIHHFDPLRAQNLADWKQARCE